MLLKPLNDETSEVAPPPPEPPLRRRRRGGWLRRLASWRRAVQLGAGALVYLVVSQLGLSLWWVVLVGSVLGVVLGKVFCRWMCPLGALMESLLGAGGGEGRQQSLYMYFKLGCPIAWVGGFLNRHSLLRVRARGDTCTDCGLCDRACYVSQLAPGHSLHQTDKTNASTHYSCSRCLECVRACPTGALTLGPRRGPLPF